MEPLSFQVSFYNVYILLYVDLFYSNTVSPISVYTLELLALKVLVSENREYQTLT